MFSLKRAVAGVALALVAAFTFAPPPASAASAAAVFGTPAWTNVPVTMMQGPGREYNIVAKAPAEIRIRVERCTRKRWCEIRYEAHKGWVKQDHLDFGTRPGGPFSGPRLNYPSGGFGLVCFYTGANYTGTAYCTGRNSIEKDLLLLGLDNKFASIAIEGNLSVMVCRDFNFTSYCQRIIKNTPTLNRYLTRNISSYRVY